MKRRLTLSLALALGIVALSPASSDSTARAQQRRVFRADTGMFTLGPDQVLRLTVTSGDFNRDGGPDISVRFRQMGYVEADNVYKLAAEDVTSPVRLKPDEAVSIDISSFRNGGSYPGIGGVVETNSQNARVTAQIIDRPTGRVSSIIAILVAL